MKDIVEKLDHRRAGARAGGGAARIEARTRGLIPSGLCEVPAGEVLASMRCRIAVGVISSSSTCAALVGLSEKPPALT